MQLIELVNSVKDELYKYKYLEYLYKNDKEYIAYILESMEKIVIDILATKNKKKILVLGNILLDLWINYDIPLYKKYFDEINHV